MLKNFLKSAFRNLNREKANTLINIAGLTLGITGALVLFLFIEEGTSYDRYHDKKERIYRVVSKSGENKFTQGIPTLLPEAFKSEFPEAEEVVLTSYRRGNLIAIPQKNGDIKKYEESKGVAFTQASFYRIFDRPLLKGEVAKSLDLPNQAAISRKWAIKYFQKEDATGEIIRYDNIEYKIAAVMQDYPSNTDLPFDLVLSLVTVKKEFDSRGWGDISDTDNCYFLLGKNESIRKLESRLPAFVQKYYGDKDTHSNANAILLQPLSSLHSDMRFGNYNTKMPVQAMIAFSVIATFLLITCCINFVNLTTAAAIKRIREAGIRKVLGSTRSQLMAKLLGESLLITLLSVGLSLAAAQFFLFFLNPFLELQLSLSMENTSVWIFLISVTLSVALLSGLYPALVVSAYKPAYALKNQAGSDISTGYMLRRGLVVFQFFISQFFIIATIIISRQLNFLQQQDTGFARNAIITVPIPVSESPRPFSYAKMRNLKNEITNLAGVEKASLNVSPPSHKSVVGTSVNMIGKSDLLDTELKSVDGDYLDLYQIRILAGESLPDLDTINGLMVNERFVKVAGFHSNVEIIGKEVLIFDKRVPVIGVVKNFNTRSLSDPIEPVVLYNSLNSFQSLSIKLNAADIPGTLSQIQSKWERTYPEYIYSYSFLDEQIKNLYRGERRISTLLTLFSSIAIAIGCLGLFGLVTFMANRKTKEIGLRKVLGASVENIVFLFSKEFVILILLGFAFAAPAAGLVMNKVLEEFAYKIDIGPWIFITGLLVTFVIAFLTVGFRSLKAALANPVESLRAE